MAEDTRVAYGMSCTWWGDIKDVGTVERGGYTLPCCPHCRGVLFQMDSEAHLVDLAKRYEREKPHPGYVDMVMWAKGRCFTSYPQMVKAYENREVTS